MRVGQARKSIVGACGGLRVGRSVSDYEAMAEVAHHVVAGLNAGRIDTATRVFEAVERCLAEGDEETIELVAVGLIEAIQNISSFADSMEPSDIRSLLGPSTAYEWEQINTVWQTVESLLPQVQ